MTMTLSYRIRLFHQSYLSYPKTTITTAATARDAITRITCRSIQTGTPYRHKAIHRTSRSFSTDITETNNISFDHPNCNIPSTIISKIGTNLHLQNHHPLNTIKLIIERYWNSTHRFTRFDNLNPIVSTHSNFDSLLIEPDHPSRSQSDTYYVDPETVLRTHTSAHQLELLQRGHDAFLVTGDVYRRDEIDSSHYPVFHQMEGVKLFDASELNHLTTEEQRDELVERDLKNGLEGMAKVLFGDVQMRWVEAYFPFTNPSFELEILFENEWLEVLGCGVVHKQILHNANRVPPHGWAFGLGLERLAMILFSIPDIRLFWSTDPRFHTQFQSGQIIKFQPYSKYPPCYKDISFWISNSNKFHANDLYEVVRSATQDLVEQVELIDEFVHPTSGKVSNCFRISYRSMDRNLRNEEVDELQERVRRDVRERLGVELR